MKKSMFSAFAVGLCMTVNVMAQVPNYVPTNGLVGWWPFNGNANDESGNGNNGTVNGATLTTDRFGNANKAYSFDGNDSIVIYNIINQNNWSISSWFKTPISNNFGLQYIFGFGNQSLSSFGIPGFGITGLNQQWPCTNLQPNKSIITDASTECLSVNFMANFEPDTWYHVIIERQGTIYSVYQNGISIWTGNMNSINLNTLKIGCRLYNWLNFKGRIDDIGIWNRALTQQEITDLYNANLCYEYVTVTDTLVINTGITGYNPITYMNTLKIWPNPTNDHITIDAGDLTTMNGYSIKIEDAQGQQVFQNAVNQQQFYIDITTWGGNGLYFVRIIDPQGNTVDIKKIVLQ
jgi:hypothetical protein